MISIVKYMTEATFQSDEDRKMMEDMMKKEYGNSYNQGKQEMKNWNPGAPGMAPYQGKKVLKKVIQPREKADPGTYSNPIKKVIKKSVEAVQQ